MTCGHENPHGRQLNRLLEDVAVGDSVKLLLLDAHVMESAQVVEVAQAYRERLFSINGRMLKVADNQPVLIQKPDGTKGWGSSDSGGTVLSPTTCPPGFRCSRKDKDSRHRVQPSDGQHN